MSKARLSYTKPLAVLKNIENKDNVTLKVFANFAYVRIYGQTKNFVWKRDYGIIEKINRIKLRSRAKGERKKKRWHLLLRHV